MAPSGMPQRVVFMGTPDFARASLEGLLDAGVRPVLVVTQPDRPAGRGHALRPPPVKALALERGMIRLGVSFPVGGSRLLVAQKV